MNSHCRKMHLEAPGCLLNPFHVLVFHLHAALLLQGLLLLVWLSLLVTHMPCLWLFSSSRFWTVSKFLVSRHHQVTDPVVTIVPSPLTCALPRLLPLLLPHWTVSQGNSHLLMDLQAPFFVFFAHIHHFASWPRSDSLLVSVSCGISFP